MIMFDKESLKMGQFFDAWFCMALFLIVALGLIMVASSSFAISQRTYGYPWYFIVRQLAHLFLGLLVAGVLLRIPMQWWQQYSGWVLLFCLLLLVLVLVPGVGREVNGSTRWLNFGFIRVQVSEIIKLGVAVYLARYLVQFNESLRFSAEGLLKPLFVVVLIGFLLLCQPDFGAAVVISSMSLALLFLGGVRIRVFLLLLLGAGAAFAILALSSPYRLQRLTAFLNPWANQFDSGYQLTQSLIAFGRAGWLGMGLGEGFQKLFYLPEAHTDFIFAIMVEELGLIGGIGLVGLFVVLIGRGLWIGHQAHLSRQHYNGFLAQAIMIAMGVQIIISVGVNTGLLPTKGLTLPGISYGGSSLVMCCAAIALILRIHYENQAHYIKGVLR